MNIAFARKVAANPGRFHPACYAAACGALTEARGGAFHIDRIAGAPARVDADTARRSALIRDYAGRRGYRLAWPIDVA